MLPFSCRRGVPRLALAALLSAPVLLVSACGGGGGGGDSTPAPVTSGAIAIDATNQKAVAAHALDSATDVGAARSSASIVTGVQVDTGAGGGGALQLAAVARVLAGNAPASVSLATGVTVNRTVPCTLGGSMTVSGQVSGTTLLPGDSITASTSACRVIVGGVEVTLNGGMNILVTAGSFNPIAPSFPSHFVMSVTVSNLSVAAAGRTDVSNGDLLIDLTEPSPAASDVLLTGASLSNTVTTGTGSRNFTLKNYRQHAVVNSGATSFEVTATIETTNSRFGSGTRSYSVSTPAPILTSAGGDFVSGSLKVVGAGNCAVLVTITAPNTFQLQLDAGGDGSYELSTPGITATDLRALL